MPTATLDQRNAGVIVARRGFSTRTEADMYAEIARAWCQMDHSSERPEYPMQTHVVGPGFARAVWDQPDIDPQEVIAVCAKVVSVESWRLSEVRQTAAGCPLEEALDPVSAWWHPLSSAPEIGLHFWRLATGMIELRSVGPVQRSALAAIRPIHREQ